MKTYAASQLTQAVDTGPLWLAMVLSGLVGVLGFASPCVLPLVPGYLSYVAGLSGTAVGRGRGPRVMVAGSVLFVSGFTVVFVAGGVLFGNLGTFITVHRRTMEVVLGALTIVLGLAFAGILGPLQRELRIGRRPNSGLVGAPVLGMVFGLGWTPCIGPTLAVVLGMASQQASAGRGAALTLAYSLGLGIPFVLIAMGVGWTTGVVGFLRRHAVWVGRAGGAVMVLIGVLLVTGIWNQWMDALRAAVGAGGFGSNV